MWPQGRCWRLWRERLWGTLAGMTSSPLPSTRPRARRSTLLQSLSLAGLLGAVAACQAHDEPKAAVTPEKVEPAAPPANVIVDPPPPAASGTGTVYGFNMKRLDGTPASLGDWSGKVLLIVNTASKCGYTPQYEGLQALHAKYSPKGFAVLGFPSNDFGGQEPGSAKEIQSFCTSIYAVNFPMFEKSSVVGPERNGLYAMLSDAKGAPGWNFHKYLIDKHGKVVEAWPSKVTPQAPEVVSAIEAQLAAP
jgi:glutathione peroxidase